MRSKRNRRTVKLNQRFGSRRNRIALAVFFLCCALATWMFGSNPTENNKKYLVALTDLPSGTPINQDMFAETPVSLGDAENLYLLADTDIKGWQIVRPIRAGELIPVTSIAKQATQDCRAIQIPISVPIPTGIHVGDAIDFWAAPQNQNSETLPNLIAVSADLRKIIQATDSLSSSTQSLEACVSIAEIRSVVNAIALRELIVAVRSK